MSDAALEAVAIGLYESRIRSTARWCEGGWRAPRSPTELDVQASLHALVSSEAWADLEPRDRAFWRGEARKMIAEQDAED